MRDKKKAWRTAAFACAAAAAITGGLAAMQSMEGPGAGTGDALAEPMPDAALACAVNVPGTTAFMKAVINKDRTGTVASWDQAGDGGMKRCQMTVGEAEYGKLETLLKEGSDEAVAEVMPDYLEAAAYLRDGGAWYDDPSLDGGIGEEMAEGMVRRYKLPLSTMDGRGLGDLVEDLPGLILDRYDPGTGTVAKAPDYPARQGQPGEAE